MKKLITLLTLLLCSVGSTWAIKVGFTSSKSGSTVAAPTVTTQDNVTVAIARGGQSTGNNKGNMYWGSTTVLSYADGATIKQERTQYNSAALSNTINENVWTGASFSISSGYKFTVSDIQVDIAGQDYEWKYKLEVVNGDGTIMYTSNGEIASPKNSSKRQITATGQSFVLTGNTYVKLYFCFKTVPSGSGASSKYMYIPELYLTGTIEENIQTNYTKPSITQGAYNQPAGTYAVTLNVQNEEDGTINYRVGDGEEVTGAASGTVINVAPSTLITAYVTGATYANSENNTLTTDAAPKLATPTYSILGYDLMKNVYSVSLSAAAGDITYTIGGVPAAYSGALTLAPSTEVEAYATQTNMTQSATLSFTLPAAPIGGNATTPTTSGTFANNTDYNLGSITIPGACIAGQISSGSTPINGSIKTRCNQGVTDGNKGFYINVNSGYTITSISIRGCSNANGANTCKAVYVDGVAVGDYTPVSLPLATGGGTTGTITVTGINATSKIEFAFENTDQAQMIITATHGVSANSTLSAVSGFSRAFTTFCAPNNFTVTGATAYKAQVNADKIELTAIEGVIPASTGVIIAGEDAASYTITFVSEDPVSVTDNDLHGVTVRTLTSTLAGSQTLLALNKDEASFQTYNGTYFPSCKAYLLVDGGSARDYKLSFSDDNETTAINSLDINNKPVQKYLKDGKLVIVKEQGTFNVAGVRIQ